MLASPVSVRSSLAPDAFFISVINSGLIMRERLLSQSSSPPCQLLKVGSSPMMPFILRPNARTCSGKPQRSPLPLKNARLLEATSSQLDSLNLAIYGPIILGISNSSISHQIQLGSLSVRVNVKSNPSFHKAAPLLTSLRLFCLFLGPVIEPDSLNRRVICKHQLFLETIQQIRRIII